MSTARAFLLFAGVGVIGFGVDVGVLYLAAPWLGWYAARLVSFIAAATATWALNRRITFANRSSGMSMGREYLSWLVTMLGGACVNYGVYVLTLHWLDAAWAPAAGVALGSCAGLVVNFVVARYGVFGRAPVR
ncbi:MAG: GtrA family protein [Gammaproteobacteria bacterium]|nr:GtrA family protein [Gammaproteobacteria bacterium]